jgi:hypothetical protein
MKDATTTTTTTTSVRSPRAGRPVADSRRIEKQRTLTLRQARTRRQAERQLSGVA